VACHDFLPQAALTRPRSLAQIFSPTVQTKEWQFIAMLSSRRAARPQKIFANIADVIF
jgi:hypothetical protein